MSKKKQRKVEIERNDLADVVQQKLEEWKPYAPIIFTVIALVIIGIGGGIWWVQNQKQKRALQWTELGEAIRQSERTEGTTTPLTEFAKNNPDSDAAMWAYFVAGDMEIRNGVTRPASQKEDSKKNFESAKEHLLKVVSSDRKLDKMLRRRATYALAYAHESLGEFEDAKKLYDQLIDEGQESPYYAEASRGASRATRLDVRQFYEKYVSWEPNTGDAPGDALPEMPNIDFPEMTQTPSSAGGQFDPTKTFDNAPKPPGQGTDDKKSSDDNDKKVVPEKTDGEKAGNKNKGNKNAGNKNAGNKNAGNKNAGNKNAGNKNAGNKNAGDKNAGDKKSADKKSEDKSDSDKTKDKSDKLPLNPA
jgi:hypothetical protein